MNNIHLIIIHYRPFIIHSHYHYRCSHEIWGLPVVFRFKPIHLSVSLVNPLSSIYHPFIIHKSSINHPEIIHLSSIITNIITNMITVNPCTASPGRAASARPVAEFSTTPEHQEAAAETVGNSVQKDAEHRFYFRFSGFTSTSTSFWVTIVHSV